MHDVFCDVNNCARGTIMRYASIAYVEPSFRWKFGWIFVFLIFIFCLQYMLCNFMVGLYITL